MSALLVAASAALFAYPFVSDRANAVAAEQSLSKARSDWTDVATSEVNEAYAAAVGYNERLAHGETGDGEYEATLVTEDGVMCWVEIPKLGVTVPVRHGTEEAVLSSGAGHLESSSLPVGGKSTHAVVTAHSGMGSNQMFDRIDDLSSGDDIVLWTLGKPLTYRVKSSELVKPDEADSLCIVEGDDLLTLVTCRPIGVNSERLLVHAERGVESATALPKTADNLSTPRGAALIAALVALAAFAIAISALLRRPLATWQLVAVEGSLPLQVAFACAGSELRRGAKMELFPLGRARLNLLGECARGRWKRVSGVPSKVRLSFAGDVLATGLVVLAADSVTASVEDGRLRLACQESVMLVFGREDGAVREEGRDVHERC